MLIILVLQEIIREVSELAYVNNSVCPAHPGLLNLTLSKACQPLPVTTPGIV
jgi:hypothetical protein